MSKSADIMHAMNKLVNVKDMSEIMTNMAREMERSGLVDEVISETMEMMEVSLA